MQSLSLYMIESQLRNKTQKLFPLTRYTLSCLYLPTSEVAMFKQIFLLCLFVNNKKTLSLTPQLFFYFLLTVIVVLLVAVGRVGISALLYTTHLQLFAKMTELISCPARSGCVLSSYDDGYLLFIPSSCSQYINNKFSFSLTDHAQFPVTHAQSINL